MNTPASTHVRPTDRPASSLRLAMAALLLATAILVAACQSESPVGDADEPPGRAVRTSSVATSDAPARLRLPGVTRSVERAELAFLHAGHLAERLVQHGDRVSPGQALAVLHNPALMPGVSAAEARVREIDEELEQLERETDRLANLHERGLVATEELDRVRARRNGARQARSQARAALDEARDQLEEATLRAPFAGQVVGLHAEPGQFVGAGQPIIALSAPDRLEVAVDLSTRQAARLAAGDPAQVSPVGGGARLSGNIREIGLPAPGRLAPAIIDLPGASQPDWLPGQAVQVELSWSLGSGLSVPLDALIDTGDGLPHVFRVRQDHAELVTVIPGDLEGGWLRVSGELEPGDEIVTAGHGQLLDGERVQVLP